MKYYAIPGFVSAFALCSSAFVSAQDTQSPPPPSGEATQVEISAGQRHLMETYGISASSARERLQLEEAVTQLANSYRDSFPDTFGGMWIEHEPTYKITVAFTTNDVNNAIRQQITPQLRRYVQFKKVKDSVAEREAKIDRLVAALDTIGVKYVSYYEHKTDDLIIETASDSGVGRLTQQLPQDLRNFVKIRRGTIPEQVQAFNTKPGDGVWGGWWFSLTSGGSYTCSFAFSAKDNQNREGILTAGHCGNTPYIYATDHYFGLRAPTLDWNQPNTKYDYQFHLTSGVSTGPWVFYNNGKIAYPGWESHSSKNAVAGYPASGYFAVSGTWGYYDQKVGQIMCKSGRSTGLTCGEITHGWYTYNGAKGWIETGKSSAYIYATFGDSGGAVFTKPGTDGKMKAAGIQTAATIYDPTPKSDGSSDLSGDEQPCTSAMEGGAAPYYIADCRMVHMPIDYIDDQQLLTVMTQ